MNTSDDLFAAVHRAGDEDAQRREDRESRLFVLGLAVCLAP